MDNNQQSPIAEKAKDIRFAEPTFIDPLTRLFNQYYLYQFLPEEMEKARLGNYPLAVCMIDLDGFKYINDTYGHLCGDVILKQLAEILKKSVRQIDMVIRYAGDEFTILLPGADSKRVEVLSGQLIENVDKNTFKGQEEQPIHLTISIGFAMYPQDADKIDKLIELADKALYLSKQRGKNRVSQAKEITLEAVSSLIAMDSFPCSKFIDRQEEIARLKNIFDTAVLRANLLKVAFISGESGIGKSRLLSELNNYAQTQAVVISCHSSLAHMQDPYYLFAKGISAYIDKIGIGNPQFYNLFSKMPAEELVELSRVIPPIANLTKSNVDLKLEDKKARFLLFKGFLDLIIELNKASPVIFSFDDVQWADKASIELVRYLSKQEKNKRIFVVCCFGEDNIKDSAAGSNLKGLLEDIFFSDNFIQIKLANLSLEDTSGMVEAIFPGTALDKEFCQFIYNTTKGNPSFVEEVLKSLVENSIIFYQDNRWQIKKQLSGESTPFSLEEIIKKRLKNIDEETKEMIVQAAVIGEDFSLDFLKKIGNKDEGYTLELLNRAKKMRLIDDLGQRGKFGFINKNVQHMLYNELNDEERNRLHYKISQVLAEEHKDNIDNVAGEMAFHYSRAPLEDRAGEYSKMFLEKAAQLYSPVEIIEYFDELAKDVVVEEEKITPLPNERMVNEAIRFVRLLQAAVKSFHLYPPGAMRTNVIKDAFCVLNNIFEEVQRLTLSEIEKGLVINGERIPAKGMEQASMENFLSLMIEYNLKSISFIKGIQDNEFDKFIQYLSTPSAAIRNTGGWIEVMKKENINGVKVDEVRFVHVSKITKGFEKKDKLKDIMLMEFLLGKVGQASMDKRGVINKMESEPEMFAHVIQEAAKEAVKEGKAKDEVKVITDSIEKINSQILGQNLNVKNDDAKNLARVVLGLSSELRNKVIRSQLQGKDPAQKDMIHNIIKVVPDEVIIDIIIEEYKESQENLLVAKDYFDKAFFGDEARKEGALVKLETELSKLNVTKENIAFVSGKIEWKDLPLPERIKALTKLPDKYYSLELTQIKGVLEELVPGQSRQELETIFYHLLVKAGQLDPLVRKSLITIMADFIKTSLLSDKIEAVQVQDRLAGLWKNLRMDSDPKVFGNCLDIFREVLREFNFKLQSLKDIILEVEKPDIRRCCLLSHQLLHILSQRYKLEINNSPELAKLCADFIKEVFSGRFLEILVYNAINVPPHEKFNLKDIFPIIGERLVDALINLETQKDLRWGDSFREYTIRKGIADLLLDIGEPALNRLKQRLSQMKEDISVSLIESLRYLRNEELIDTLLPFLKHKDPLIRRSTILALGDIGSQKSLEAISGIIKTEKDKRIRLIAKEQLKKLRAKGLVH